MVTVDFDDGFNTKVCSVDNIIIAAPTGTFSRLRLTPAGLQSHRVAASHVNTCHTSTHILWSCVASFYAMLSQ